MGLFLLLQMVGCTPMVHTSMEKGAGIREYKTYSWLEPEIKTGDNPKFKSELVHRNIEGTVEKELERRGFIKDTVNPDLLVQYHTYTEKKTNTSFYGGYNPYFSPFYGPIGFGWGGYGYGISPYNYMGYGGRPAMTQEYTQGSLILDFKDKKTDQIIWQGSIEGDVENTRNLALTVQKAVTAIMKKYPFTSPDNNINNDKDEKAPVI